MNTMKLYKIIVLHGSPKDSHTSTETYLVADNEESVFEWINAEKAYDAWTEEPSDGEEPNVRYADDDCEKKSPSVNGSF